MFCRVPITTESYELDDIDNINGLYPPIMEGTIFSIDREFFYEIGTYDAGMIIGENLELSLRV